MLETKTQPQFLPTHDSLTELPNHTFFHCRLQETLARKKHVDQPFALLILGLAQFREINRSLGYHMGDLLLKQVGSRVQGILKNLGTLARLSGVEFAVLLPSVGSTEEVILVVRRILEGLEQPFVLGDLKLDVQASIGIVLFPEHGTNADALIQRANVALSTAKTNHSSHAIYCTEQEQNNHNQLLLTGDLRRALVEDQLFLLYQPKLDLRTGRVSGVEALARWQHPQYGIIPPDQFIPVAEQTGLIMPFTLWVLHEALRQCHAWNQAGLNIKVATNLSMWNLQARELPDQIAGLLKSCEVSPDQLELEITESSIMANPARTMENLTSMSHMGLQISIDDFGTGHSSMAYLKKLPVHEIKIDQSFVMNMAVDKDDVVIVRAMIDLGHRLGLKVVAEGVENQKTQTMLSTFNCDTAQGFHISTPIPASEITRWLTESHTPKLKALP
ncbi:MAG: putative bifunctional diguanylate cyclase/phosphodiesterase [Candidatus Binatia bacterium]